MYFTAKAKIPEHSELKEVGNVCSKCGLHINADVNGAVNILRKYLRPLGRSSANVSLAKVIKWKESRLSLEALSFRVG
jgi:transposase